jgi:hypothetical protein
MPTGSKDEEEKDWNFQELDAVLTDIATKNTGIGGILAAMVYQIDHTNKTKKNGTTTLPNTQRSEIAKGGGLIRVENS